MSDKLDLLLVGIGGYGANYVTSALDNPELRESTRITGVVDPLAEQSNLWPKLQQMGIPRFNRIAEFSESGRRAGLAIISSPIAFHAGQCAEALAGGADVLCEKPMCATIQQAHAMIKARDASGRMLSIGYQRSFSEAIHKLKRDILAGRFGAPLEMRTWVGWPRGRKYYTRNNWAGRLRDEQGRWVLDSPVNNATAHFLHNMLYLLGPETGLAATPTAITAECYRAGNIENFNAACCRVETSAGTPLMFFSAHCIETGQVPTVNYRFEKAVISYNGDGELVARLDNGEVLNYGIPDAEPMRKFRLCIEWSRSGTPRQSLCGPEAAMMHTLCVNGMQETEIRDFPASMTKTLSLPDGDEMTVAEGLGAAMEEGFTRGKLFSEMNMPWAVPARRIDLTGYSCFPGGKLP